MSDKRREEKVAVLFPGQGSQFVGMGREFAESDPELLAIFELAERCCGIDIRRLCFSGPLEELTVARHLQPALTTVNLVCWRAAQKAGLGADYLAGHSLGEYAALHAAGVLGLEDSIRLVAERGRVMGQAGARSPGGMVALLGLTLPEVQGLLAGLAAPEGIAVGNHNSEQQVVISGRAELLAQASELAVARGAKAVPLNVTVANHSPLMRPAMAELEPFLAKVAMRRPQVPCLFNVTAQPEDDPEAIRRIMARQIVSPVRWQETIANLVARQAMVFIEVGPKKVLTGLLKRMLPKGGGHRCYQVESPETLRQCLAELG